MSAKKRSINSNSNSLSLGSVFPNKNKIPKLKNDNLSSSSSFSLSTPPNNRISNQSKLTPGEILKESNDFLTSKSATIFNDNIHQHIRIDILSKRIIDTPEFQRLRKLKQLGTTNYVYTGAVHSRFEHSVGVAHLAEKVVNILCENQPELGITNSDRLCVKIAGLCHDLGHGPFSHLYDGVFINRMHKKYNNNSNELKWHHEEGSINMFKYILSNNNINLIEYGLTSEDQLFIEEIIGGVEDIYRKGRLPNKFFLYDIVNNTRSGLDVDKLDYYLRDMKNTNVIFKRNFDRFIQLGRVLRSEPIHENVQYLSNFQLNKSIDKYIQINDKYVEINSLPYILCYPEKLVSEAVDFFRVRFSMHRDVYTHKAVKQIEFMITDALELADPYIRITGNCKEGYPDGLYKISECIYDMKALSNLNDSIIDIILHDKRNELKPAQDIINRINSRNLYICLGKTSFDRNSSIFLMNDELIQDEIILISNYLSQNYSQDKIINILTNNNNNNIIDYDEPSYSQQSQRSSIKYYEPIIKNELIIERMHIHFGLKDKNPVDRMRFYPKNKNNLIIIGKKINEKSYETSLPRVFEELAIRLFCKNSKKEDIARKSFDIWCIKMNINQPFPSQSQPSYYNDENNDDNDFIYSPDFSSPY